MYDGHSNSGSSISQSMKSFVMPKSGGHDI